MLWAWPFGVRAQIVNSYKSSMQRWPMLRGGAAIG
jgi:hypothetical protein